MSSAKQADVMLGVDVGGTHIRVAVVDTSGKILKSVRHNLTERDPQSLLDKFDAMRGELGYGDDDDLPIGMGLAGQIWIDSGTVVVAPNLGWHNVAFGDMLKRRFKQRVRLVNDLNAIAVGESLYGAGEGAHDVICVFVGTGVGMGAVVHGQVMEGGDGLATELGHTKVASVTEGRLCGCGERGCLEAYTSGRHLPELLAEKVAAGMPSRLFESVKGQLDALQARQMDEAASDGDAAARAVWDDVCEHLARAIGNTITLFNPRVLVLGGGVLVSAPNLKKRLAQRLQAYAARPAWERLKVRDTVLADDAGVIGSAMLASFARRGADQSAKQALANAASHA